MAEKRNTSGSIPLARVGGIAVRMHWTFLVLVLVVVWATMGAGAAAVVTSLVWIVAIFASVLIHEYAHCVVARRRGAVVVDILLLPIGGLSRLEKVPERPDDELAIAVVGPLTSLGLAAVAMVGGLLVGAHMWPPTLFAGSWFARLAWLNILLGAFNLLPALPMDGGRVLRAALERREDRATATHQAGTIARVLATVMIVGGLFYDFWLVLIGIFVYLGATAEEQAAMMERDTSAGRGRPGPHPPPTSDRDRSRTPRPPASPRATHLSDR
ncbi:MAG TPA: site-2 protease family protein [Acidimicrobiales bacterium]|nr:site-2 protease family protein [Acidimicrobiales bacterium]